MLKSQQQLELENNLTEFENQLIPIELVNKIGEELTKYFISRQNKLWQQSNADSTKAIFTGNKFIKTSLSHIKKNYGISPLFILCNGTKKNQLASWYSAKQSKYNKFRKEVITYFLSSKALPNMASKNVIKLREQFINEAYKINSKIFSKKNSIYHTTKTFQKLISTYSVYKTYNDKCACFYSDYYGFQNFYILTHPIIFNNAYFGSFTIAFLESDFVPEKLLETSLKAANSEIKRSISIKKQAKQKNKLITSKLAPAEFLALIKKDTALEYLMQKRSYLQVEYQGNQHSTLLLETQRLSSFFAKLVILSAFGLVIYFMCFSIRIPVSIRHKYLILLGIILFIPNLFIFYLTSISHSQIQLIQLAQTKQKLQTDIAFLDGLLKEAEFWLQLEILKLKKILTHKVQKMELSPAIKLTSQEHSIGFETEFLDINGNTLMSKGNQFYFGKKNILRQNYALNALKNVGALNTKSPRINNLLKQVEVAGGLMDEYLEFIDLPRALGAESELIQDYTKADLLSRMAYLLIPGSGSSAFSPIAFVHLNVKREHFANKFFKALIGYPLKLLHKSTPNSETFFDISVRDHSKVIHPTFFSTRTLSSKMRKSLTIAMKTKDSGIKKIGDGFKTQLLAWNYRLDSPYVITAQTILKRDPDVYWFFTFFPVIALAFSLVAIILLAEITANIFITPLNTVELGVAEIHEKENFNIRLDISSNDEFTQMGNVFNEMILGLLQKKHLGRFVSSKLIEEIERSDTERDNFKVTEAVVLSTDIRGFTSLSEQKTAEEIVSLLNDYFTSMEKVIVSYHGIIDKFIGDAIIAIFFPKEGENHLLNCCKAACEMRRQLAIFNNARADKKLFKIETGIGISFGKVILGKIGSQGNRMDYTITGSIIDQANQLEAASIHTQSKIVISNEIKEKLSNKYELLELPEKANINGFELSLAINK